jgi:hypothetical protein
MQHREHIYRRPMIALAYSASYQHGVCSVTNLRNSKKSKTIMRSFDYLLVTKALDLEDDQSQHIFIFVQELCQSVPAPPSRRCPDYVSLPKLPMRNRVVVRFDPFLYTHGMDKPTQFALDEPCPFCRPVPEVAKGSIVRSLTYQVVCNACGARGPDAETEELAIIAWNAWVKR